VAAAVTALLLAGCSGCARTGRLTYAGHTVAPVTPDSTSQRSGPQKRAPLRKPPPGPLQLRPLFGDTLIGLRPGTADSTIRFLGRLRDGYTADTLNVFICGDNRPGYRLNRLQPQFQAIREGVSLNPIKIVRGLVNIPIAVARGLYPDLALIREIPSVVGHMPKWSREHEVMRAMLVKIDSVRARGQNVAAVINTGDLVKDGRRPAHWERFLRITEPLTSRVPYFAVAGNHERTDTEDGVENWRMATGLPVGSDRLYYCFDSADGWVRFIALDSNPMVNNGSHWTRKAQVEYSDEQVKWMVERIREHPGPVLVMMHHPPFSVGSHRQEWQRDTLLVNQRERMVRSMHEAGISILATGHEHSYQRALLTWPDAAMIILVTGGTGAPINPIPPPAASAQLFASYRVAGSVVKPENVFTSQVFNFTHLRLWFGGGEITTYAVDEKANSKTIDQLKVDLERYGIPKVDQYKVIVPPTKGPTEPEKPEAAMPNRPAGEKVDSTQVSARLLSKPPPGLKSKKPAATVKRKPKPKPNRKPTAAKVDSSAVKPPVPPTPMPGKR
jgi:hypothetical protein